MARGNRRGPDLERALGIAAVLSLAVAWIVGALRSQSDLIPTVLRAIPGAEHAEAINGDMFRVWGDSAEQQFLGYVALGEASGYGGPLVMAVGFTEQGELIGAAVASSKETPSWLERVLDEGFLDDLIGKSYSDPFKLGNDIDAVTGATYSSEAIATAAMRGGLAVAEQVGLPAVDQPASRFVFGIPEIVLVVLFAVGYIGHRANFKYKNQARWASMIVGLVVLGFVFNSPLTIAYINRFLLGFWPDWRTDIYWYLLIGGILFVFSVDNKNSYCEWFCPFGAAQECMGAIGGAKVRSPGRYRTFLKWLQRGLAWGAIFTALLLRNPGVASYEVFGTLFELLGSSVQFLLLGMVLLASLFIRRPWCTYLCPLHPVDEFIRMIRKWAIVTWRTRRAA